jgi:hypothetical protein
MDTVFWSSVGAAAGGFIGVILFFLVRVCFEQRRTQPRHVRTYLCGNNRNQGQSTEAEGELMHHHGKRVVDQSELQKMGVDHPVWEWTKDPVGRGAGASTIYGPYATDFAKPGTYSAVFRIKATGLTHPNDITDDVVLLQLDINNTISEYMPTERGVAAVKAQYQAGIRYVRASELAQQGWVDFELHFHSRAQGVWEYRMIANDGLDNKPDNIGRFGEDVKIFFDIVTIHEVKESFLPSV